MQTVTIEMPREQAIAKLEAYRRASLRKVNEEVRLAKRAYEEVARGRVLLDLHQSMAMAGWGEEGCPRLAIARADRKWVRFEEEWSLDRPARIYLFSSSAIRAWRGRIGGPGLNIEIPRSAMPARPPGGRSALAMVPMVPPDVPPRPTDLSKKFILFEAEWKPIPPRDPMLLEHIAGPLYAVIAHWELTEIERAVMAQRERPS